MASGKYKQKGGKGYRDNTFSGVHLHVPSHFPVFDPNLFLAASHDQ